MKVLLDNSVVDRLASLDLNGEIKLYITVRSDNDNPSYKENYPHLDTIPSIARFGHSVWDGGELWGSDETEAISNKLLTLAAHQKEIKKPAKQTSQNQRDDADIITAAIIAEVDYLVSDDSKFMLLESVRGFAKNEHNLEILSSVEFIDKII